MSEMVKRVARALASKSRVQTTEAYWRDMARAAIEAMREPTEAMVIAGAETIDERLSNTEAFRQIRDIWPDMVDEALK